MTDDRDQEEITLSGDEDTVDEHPAGAEPNPDESTVKSLRQQAEAARRSGDYPTAEKRMIELLGHMPHDQEAIAFLERCFRSRSDWKPLRDLLVNAIDAPHFDSESRIVRLREAARLSEEQLDDINGALHAWRAIRTRDPNVRDAQDALIRLYSNLLQR